jgi:hypothetical protein
MNALPADLKALPTMPYSSRPLELPLDVEECRTALWIERGNITKAATRLKVDSARLRRFIKASRYLTEEQNEAREQLNDIAEDVVYDALTDESDNSRRDAMAKFVLLGPGKDRGYGTGAPKVTVNNNKGGTVIVGWADGTQFEPGTTIEGEVVND